MGEDHDNWFTNLMQARAFEESMKNKFGLKAVKGFMVYYEAPIRAIVCWLMWVGIMIAYSLLGLDWSFVQAVYFAISTLSTGGHWGVPVGAPDWMWPLTGFFAMIGGKCIADRIMPSIAVGYLY